VTRAEIQALIDGLPSVGAVPEGTGESGGIVEIENGVHTLDGPLLGNSSVWLRGEGRSRTTIRYDHATDAPIMISNAGGFIEDFQVSHMTLRNDLGGGIKFHSNMTGGDSVDLNFHDLILRTGGTAPGIDLVNPGDVFTYFPKLVNIRAKSCGGMFISGKMHNGLIDGCAIVNVDRAGSFPTQGTIKLVGISGSGGSATIQNSDIEGSRGCPLLYLEGGVYNWLNSHNETAQGTDSATPVDQQILVDNALVIADEFYFMQPRLPAKVANGGQINFLRRINAQSNLGADDPTLIPQCYLSDGDEDNRVIFAGYSYVGKQVTPIGKVPRRG
jgi:hypothetical protein